MAMRALPGPIAGIEHQPPSNGANTGGAHTSGRPDATREAFAAIGARAFEPALARTAPDYKHHLVPMGIDTVGAEGFRETIVPLTRQIELKQHLVDTIELGDFVLATVRATSSLRPGQGTIAYVLRWEGDQVAEIWSISDPLPET